MDRDGHLRLAWNLLADGRVDVALDTLGRMVPGDLAERSRMLFILDRGGRANEEELPSLPVLDEQTWTRLLDWEREGDAALRRNDREGARRAFDELGDLAQAVGDQLGEVDALLGSAEIDRQQDRNAEAEAGHREALERCEQFGFRFGAARARLGLGYVIARTRSAVEAQEEFALALRGDDRRPVGCRQRAAGHRPLAASAARPPRSCRPVPAGRGSVSGTGVHPWRGQRPAARSRRVGPTRTRGRGKVGAHRGLAVIGGRRNHRRRAERARLAGGSGPHGR